MKRRSLWKQILVLFVAVLLGYALIFQWIEHRRRRNGPWEATFTRLDDAPALVIQHVRLGLTNIVLVFLGMSASELPSQTVRFQHGETAPFDLPFGKCVRLDTMFLPGTVVCEMFGHEIQFMPRALTIDRAEYPWRPGEKIFLTNTPSATLQGR